MNREAIVAEIEARKKTLKSPVFADFGAGDGRFTASLLKRSQVLRRAEKVLLIEPAPAYSRACLKEVRRVFSGELRLSKLLPTMRSDIIVSNHVLYYVPDIEVVVKQLIKALSDRGVCIIVMADQSNDLIKFWKYWFLKAKISLPYFLNVDFERVLRSMRVHCEKKMVRSILSFKDTRENRQKIAQFLLGNHFSLNRRGWADRYFDRFKRGPKITMSLDDVVYVIEGERRSAASFSVGKR